MRFAAIAAACTLVLLSGCATEPWVKPYERERLADPIMKPGSDGLAARADGHGAGAEEGASAVTNGLFAPAIES